MVFATTTKTLRKTTIIFVQRIVAYFIIYNQLIDIKPRVWGLLVLINIQLSVWYFVDCCLSSCQFWQIFVIILLFPIRYISSDSTYSIFRLYFFFIINMIYILLKSENQSPLYLQNELNLYNCSVDSITSSYVYAAVLASV